MDAKGYRLIIEELLKLLDEGVYIVDHQGVGLFYNEAMATIEQINVGDVLGKEYHKAFPGVPISESTMFRALKKGKRSDIQEQHYKNLYGREVSTINTTVPVISDGEIIAAVEVARDITGIKTMSDTILQLHEEKPVIKKTPVLGPVIKNYTFDDIIGENEAFQRAIDRAKKAAENRATVFIFGETGTGKELFAQSIHWASDRKDMPFLAQNCAAIPETLLEGILFGTAKGGFTGAVDRAGLFEQASGGTLLLDEISAMPYELQGKLLRVLQEEYIRRVGGTKDIRVDTRIIATVNEDPQKLIEEGRLRKDLYYRLNVVNISIPPLRARMDDIPLLVQYFLETCSKKLNKEVWMIGERALQKLERYNYPGNVRELENIIMGGVSMTDNEHVLAERFLYMPTRAEVVGPPIEKWDRRAPLADYLESIEKEMIRSALLENGGNISKAARDLGLKRQTLQHKMRKLEIKGE